MICGDSLSSYWEGLKEQHLMHANNFCQHFFTILDALPFNVRCTLHIFHMKVTLPPKIKKKNSSTFLSLICQLCRR